MVSTDTQTFMSAGRHSRQIAAIPSTTSQGTTNTLLELKFWWRRRGRYILVVFYYTCTPRSVDLTVTPSCMSAETCRAGTVESLLTALIVGGRRALNHRKSVYQDLEPTADETGEKSDARNNLALPTEICRPVAREVLVPT